MTNHHQQGEPFNGEQVVNAHWPLAAVDSDHTVAAASAAAELIRYLNHATLPGRSDQGVSSAPDLDRVVRDLTVLAAQLPQLLTQLDAIAVECSHDPSLYDDRRDRPGEDTAIGLAVELEDAKPAAVQLHAALILAAEHSTHLGHDIPA